MGTQRATLVRRRTGVEERRVEPRTRGDGVHAGKRNVWWQLRAGKRLMFFWFLQTSGSRRGRVYAPPLPVEPGHVERLRAIIDHVEMCLPS